jgi:hypothetical protein
VLETGDAALDPLIGIRLPHFLQNHGPQRLDIYVWPTHQVDEGYLLALIGDLLLGCLRAQFNWENSSQIQIQQKNGSAPKRAGDPGRPFRVVGMLEENRERAAYGRRKGPGDVIPSPPWRAWDLLLFVFIKIADASLTLAGN